MSYYKKYTKKEMRKIIKNKGYLIVETSNGDFFRISKEDVTDFIMLESERCGYSVDMAFYIPGFDIVPLTTTYSCFLAKKKKKFRADIIDRLIKLQQREIMPKKVKIFENKKFLKMVRRWKEKKFLTEMFEKFFRKYY